MNFLLCNRCNKKSEDNILNFNSTEILLKNNNNLINNNIIKKIDSIDQFQNLNIGGIGENIVTSISNLKNVEEEKEDELEIIEYPYTKKEKIISTSKIKPKQFKNNKSKFNAQSLIEQDILKQLNHFGDIARTKKNQILNIKNEIKKKQIGGKPPIIRINDRELERKDTMTDPANIALSSLIQDINKKKKNKEKINIEKTNRKKEDEEEIKTINNELENDFFELKNSNDIKISQKTKNKHNNIIKKDIEKSKIHNRKNRKSCNDNNNRNNKKYMNLINKITERKISQNKKISEYNSNIIRKKNLLKNKGILINNNNLGINSINYSNKKNFPKSYSFNYFNSEKKINETNFSQKGVITNELGYSLTLSKKYNKLYNNIFKANEGFLPSKKNEKNNKCKITHKKVSRAQAPIHKALSSHIASYN